MVLEVSWFGPTGSQRADALSGLKILFGFWLCAFAACGTIYKPAIHTITTHTQGFCALNLSLVIRSIEKCYKDWWSNGWRAPAALHACQSWIGVNPAAQLQAGGKCRLRAGVAVSSNCVGESSFQWFQSLFLTLLDPYWNLLKLLASLIHGWYFQDPIETWPVTSLPCHPTL